MQTQERTSKQTSSLKWFNLVAVVIALCAACVLAACAGQPSASSGAAASSEPAAASDAGAPAGAAGAAAPVDVSGWKTLGDAYAVATDMPSYSYNDSNWVSMFRAGDSVIRVVAKMQPGVGDKLYELEFEDPDYNQKLIDMVGALELTSAEDVTAKQLDQSAVEALVGKTGQELMDEGFQFESYFLYGGEQTGASMGKDYFSYEFTFDTMTSEDSTEDGGESIKGGTVVEAATNGNFSDLALDPEQV